MKKLSFRAIATLAVPVLVIQSGAIAPDSAMVDALTRLGYHVQGFSGVPPADNERASYSRKLRLAAAQGGLTHILCYWGTLESTKEGQASKTVSRRERTFERCFVVLVPEPAEPHPTARRVFRPNTTIRRCE